MVEKVGGLGLPDCVEHWCCSWESWRVVERDFKQVVWECGVIFSNQFC